MRSTRRARPAAPPAVRARACGCAPRCWPAPGRRWSPARPTWPSAWACRRRRRLAWPIEPLGELDFVFAVAPHHPLAARSEPLSDAELLRHRAVAVADSAQRLSPLTREPAARPGRADRGQHRRPRSRRCCAAWAAASCPSRWCATTSPPAGWWCARCSARASRCAWATPGAATCDAEGRRKPSGLALDWWLEQLKRPATRRALLERHALSAP